MPEVRKLEERGKLEKSRFGKLKNSTHEQMISLWSG
jgi:hypothetical protein